MSRLPSLGKYADGTDAAIDLPRLLETRLLVQASSGFGKSWLVRRLLEQTAGHVQQFVIDPDGEYATLREKHDFVIAAAHDGDALAHPKTAALLARRLLETGVSAILDIYDLKPHERHAFVRLFLQTMVDAPKALWHPVLVVVDEAHIYCPQVGESEAAGAVVDLATRGRKRGFGIVLATQRLSKLNKDAAAECLNKLIGRAGLDIDVKRAGDDLGMAHRDATEKLRSLTPGEFFAYGPALSADVQRMKVGKVETTHPKAGERSLVAPPKPTAAIKAVLPQLADLPKEAEQEARTLEDLKRELATARRELTAAQKAQPVAKESPATKAELRAALSTVKNLRHLIGELMKFVVKINAEGFGKDAGVDPAELRTAIDAAVNQAMKSVNAAAAGREKTIQRLQSDAGRLIAACQKLLADEPIEIAVNVQHQAPYAVKAAPALRARPQSNGGSADTAIPRGEAAILSACIQYPDGLRREQLTVLTGYKRSTRDAYIQRLGEKGYTEIRGDLVVATDAGMSALPGAEPLPTGQALQDFWRQKLPEGERKIFDVLVEAWPQPVERGALEESTGYKRSTRDAYLQRMGAKQLITEPSRGEVRAVDALFS